MDVSSLLFLRIRSRKYPNIPMTQVNPIGPTKVKSNSSIFTLYCTSCCWQPLCRTFCVARHKRSLWYTPPFFVIDREIAWIANCEGPRVICWRVFALGHWWLKGQYQISHEWRIAQHVIVKKAISSGLKRKQQDPFGIISSTRQSKSCVPLGYPLHEIWLIDILPALDPYQ
jgi:hypothetical protein